MWTGKKSVRMPSYNKVEILYKPGEAERIMKTLFTPEQQAELKRLAAIFVESLEDAKKEREPETR